MKESITFEFKMDGNQWCCHLVDFIDLQCSPAGFGDTKLDALMELLEKLHTDLTK